MPQEPASIRFNNPGAMWGKNAISRKWGETSTVVLNDGLNQGNNIAFFPNKVRGAAAQFDLWRTKYCNMTLANAIRKWSGGNWSQPYANFLTQETGISMNSMVDIPLLAGDRGWRLMKAQAHWEAGKTYPLSDSEWHTAQAMCFGTTIPMSTAKKKGTATTTIAVGTGTAAAAAARSGMPSGFIVAIVFVGVLVAVGIWFYLHKRRE